MATQVALSLRNERLIATMSVLFGVMATLLAVVGLYGVMAYTVSRRTREIGIRMALGARRDASPGWSMREVLTIAGIGIAIGLPAAWWLSRYVTSQLYEVQPTDPLTIVAAVVLLDASPPRRADSVRPRGTGVADHGAAIRVTHAAWSTQKDPYGPRAGSVSARYAPCRIASRCGVWRRRRLPRGSSAARW